jgi:BirA family biotin operon repressor/biotin-[acetyl-CoA-carboxylase] ligase
LIEQPTLIAPYRLIELDAVDSTNAYARGLAAEGTDDPIVVWAKKQTAGRGRYGRAWDSPEGNLYCSILLHPKCDIARAAQLSFLTAVTLSDVVRNMVGTDRSVGCKWPNDVLVDGAKIAGILLESHTTGPDLAAVVIGTGVNVTAHPPEDAVETPATSLQSLGVKVDAATVLERYVAGFAHWLAVWTADGFAPVREAWLAHAAGLGQPVRVRLAKETINGTFEGLDETGGLIVATESGDRRTVTAGDVFFG